MADPIALFGTDLFEQPVRTGKQFRASRKVGRAHQNMLVFVKGNPRTATTLCEGQETLL